MSSKLKVIVKDLDYLIPLISYLGSNPYWWARSADALADELSLERNRVARIFREHKTIFRESKVHKDGTGPFYSLQMRYARRNDGKTDELAKSTALPVLSEGEVIGLIDFLVRISSMQTAVAASRWTSIFAVVAAFVSSAAAIVAAILASTG